MLSPQERRVGGMENRAVYIVGTLVVEGYSTGQGDER